MQCFHYNVIETFFIKYIISFSNYIKNVFVLSVDLSDNFCDASCVCVCVCVLEKTKIIIIVTIICNP